MEYEKIELPKKRTRRTLQIDLPCNNNHVVIDIPSSACGSDTNYLAILTGESYVQFAFGGYHYEQDNTRPDPLPDDNDFHTINAHGHYEVDGRMFNSDLRLWLRGEKPVTLIY